MPLATPPPVRIGNDPTWHPTVFDPTVEAATVQRGAVKLPRAGVEFQYWAITVNDDPAQVIRLRCAGPDSAAGDRVAVGQEPAAVVVPIGRHRTTVQIRVGAEVILRDGDRYLEVD